MSRQREKIEALEKENAQLRAMLNDQMVRETTPPPPSTPPPCQPGRRLHKLRRDDSFSLWIVHDNSVLGAAMSSGGEVLIETATQAGPKAMVWAKVSFSGTVETSRATGALRAGTRGGYCFQLKSCRCIAMEPERERKKLSAATNFSCVPLTNATPLTSRDQALSFFECCHGRVDVILCPQRLREDGSSPQFNSTAAGVPLEAAPWFPYWDSDNRKLAPQFRSRGVGYVRLGDDMSNHGLAFVSLDGNNYVDRDANIEAAAAVHPVVSSPDTRTPKTLSRLKASRNRTVGNKCME